MDSCQPSNTAHWALHRRLQRERAKVCDARAALSEISEFVQESQQKLRDFIFSLPLDVEHSSRLEELWDDLDRDWIDFKRHQELITETEDKIGSLETTLNRPDPQPLHPALEPPEEIHSEVGSTEDSQVAEELSIGHQASDPVLHRISETKAARTTLKELAGGISSRLRDIARREELLEDRGDSLPRDQTELREDLEAELVDLERQLREQSQQLQQLQDQHTSELTTEPTKSCPHARSGLQAWIDGLEQCEHEEISGSTNSAGVLTPSHSEMDARPQQPQKAESTQISDLPTGTSASGSRGNTFVAGDSVIAGSLNVPASTDTRSPSTNRVETSGTSQTQGIAGLHRSFGPVRANEEQHHGVRTRALQQGTPQYTEEIYRRQHESLYQFGTLFKTVGKNLRPSDERTGGGSNMTTITEEIVGVGAKGAVAVEKARRFVVVGEGAEFCDCLLITTNLGLGVAQLASTDSKRNWLIAHCSETIPELTAAEMQTQSDPELRLPGIRFLCDDPAEGLDIMSRLNLGHVYRMKYKVKARILGTVDEASKVTLRDEFNRVNGDWYPFPSRSTDISSTPGHGSRQGLEASMRSTRSRDWKQDNEKPLPIVEGEESSTAGRLHRGQSVLLYVDTGEDEVIARRLTVANVRCLDGAHQCQLSLPNGTLYSHGDWVDDGTAIAPLVDS